MNITPDESAPPPRRNDYELFPRSTVGVHACTAGNCPAQKAKPNIQHGAEVLPRRAAVPLPTTPDQTALL